MKEARPTKTQRPTAAPYLSAGSRKKDWSAQHHQDDLEIVTGIRSLDSLEKEGLDEDVEASISDYCLVMLKIKKKIGAARMSVLTKNLEFIRIIYGGPRSEFVIIVMYACQCCG